MNDSVRLGKWVVSQRYEYNQGLLSPKRIKELESLSGWVWKTRSDGNFLPFEAAREIARSLKFNSVKEWEEWSKTKRPDNIPSAPWGVYKDSGWLSYPDWLGTNLGWHGYHHLPFKKARKIVRSLRLKNRTEWEKWSKTARLDNIPKTPWVIYKDKGWVSFCDWIGIPERFNCWLPFKKARKHIWKLKLKGWSEWNEYLKSGDKPDNIPKIPYCVYKNEWISWGDWFGTMPGFDGFLPFEEARKFVGKLKLKTIKEWREYSKSGKKPDNIPACPNNAYKGKGWQGVKNWLGTEHLGDKRRHTRV